MMVCRCRSLANGGIMQPIQVSYRGLEPSPALSELIDAEVEHLQRLNHRIHALRVVVAAPPHHQRHGSPYRVRVELTMPRAELVVDGDHDVDAYQATRHAFETLRRQLTTIQERRQAKQRAHVTARNVR
jgi:ribosomal subunit interface protein